MEDSFLRIWLSLMHFQTYKPVSRLFTFTFLVVFAQVLVRIQWRQIKYFYCEGKWKAFVVIKVKK